MRFLKGYEPNTPHAAAARRRRLRHRRRQGFVTFAVLVITDACGFVTFAVCVTTDAVRFCDVHCLGLITAASIKTCQLLTIYHAVYGQLLPLDVLKTND